MNEDVGQRSVVPTFILLNAQWEIQTVCLKFVKRVSIDIFYFKMYEKKNYEQFDFEEENFKEQNKTLL